MAGLVPYNKTNQSIFNTGMPDLDYMLDDFFSAGLLPRRMFMRDTFKIDVEDCETKYEVTAELPGAKKDEIAVDIDDGRLTISVTKEKETDDSEKNYVHKERSVSSMSRSVFLNDAATEGIEAKLDDGVLSIMVPKVEPASKKSSVEIK